MLSLVSLLVLARGGGPDDGPATWLDLDAATRDLAAGQPSSALDFGLLVRAFYTVSPEEASNGSEDVSGNVFEDLDVHFAMKSDDVQWRVSADFATGSMVFEDAYARWRHAEWLALTFGQFRPRVLRSGSVEEDGLLFRERTYLGAAFDVRDNGLEIGGHRDQFDYWFALTNAENGEETDPFGSLRGEWALFDAAGAEVEGAQGAPNYMRAVLGGVLFRDLATSSEEGGGYALDLAVTYGPYAVFWEWARLEEQFARTIDVFNGELLTLGDGQPFSVTFSRCVGRVGEAAVRYQRADDDDHTSSVGASTRWVLPGAPGTLIADLSRVEADSEDFSLFSIGLCMGSSDTTRRFDGAGGW